MKTIDSLFKKAGTQPHPVKQPPSTAPKSGPADSGETLASRAAAPTLTYIDQAHPNPRNSAEPSSTPRADPSQAREANEADVSSPTNWNASTNSAGHQGGAESSLQPAKSPELLPEQKNEEAALSQGDQRNGEANARSNLPKKPSSAESSRFSSTPDHAQSGGRHGGPHDGNQTQLRERGSWEGASVDGSTCTAAWTPDLCTVLNQGDKRHQTSSHPAAAEKGEDRNPATESNNSHDAGQIDATLEGIDGIDLAEQKRIMHDIWLRKNSRGPDRAVKKNARKSQNTQSHIPKQPRLTDIFAKKL